MKHKYSFWAKKDDKSGVFKWLPLYQHLIDTKEVAGLLWEHWLSFFQKKLVSNLFIEKFPYNSYEKGKNLVMFLAQIHDIGKATPAFQISRKGKYLDDLSKILIENSEIDGFDGLKEIFLSSPHKSPHVLAGEYILHLYGFNSDICSIIGAHHGKPVDNIDIVKNQSAYDKNYYQSENPKSDIYKKWSSAQKDIIKWALEQNDFSDISDLPTISQPVCVLLSGIVIMSDWIASNEDYFPLIPVDESQISDQKDRIINGWNRWKGDIKTTLWEMENISDINELYKNRFHFTARNTQEILAHTINNIKDPGIIIFEAPMGCGKTEASLIAVEQLAYKKGLSGMFFGLPTQSTSNGMFTRIYDWLKNLDESSGNISSIRLSHGKSSLNEDFTSISKNINTDQSIYEDKNFSVVVNDWFSGRKTSSLDDFVVGTVDYFLLLALKQRHLALRHLGFTKKVVVIDEVHAYDTYMGHYLLKAIQWLGAYKIPVLILSATLPAEKREKMIKDYLISSGIKISDIKNKLSSLEKDVYPLITYTDGSEIKQEKIIEKDSVKKLIKMVKLENDLVYQTVDKYYSENAIVGIILNTVKSAQDVAKDLISKYGKDSLFLLHSSFIATDRIKKENNLLNMIGKNATRSKSKIIIGTQVMEQSLDIDFDVLITDLAPMDLLIQRIGRLHRHENVKRPDIAKNPTVYVLNTSQNLEFDKKISSIYDEYVLTRTQYFLPEKITIPDDISPLVQKVYGKDEINLEEKYKDRYDLFKNNYKKKIEDKKNNAKVFSIDKPVIKPTVYNKTPSLIGWLETSSPNESEERAFARVRDIDEVIEVVILKKIGSGYGFFGSDEDISSKIGDMKINKEISKNTITLPKILSTYKNIDKTITELESYNYKNLSNWQNQIWLKGLLGMIFDENNKFNWFFVNKWGIKIFYLLI